MLQIYTRTDPSKAKLNITNTKIRGLAGLIQIMIEEAGVTVSDMTVRRFIANELEELGLIALCESCPDHNVCCLCKMWKAEIDMCHENMTRAEQQAAASPAPGGSSTNATTNATTSAATGLGPESAPANPPAPVRHWQHQLDMAAASLESHMKGHYEIKTHLFKLIAYAKVLRLDELAGNPDADTQDHPLRSRDQIYIHHIDGTFVP